MIPTPFEATGVWTDHAAEGAFLDAVDADSGRVTVSTIGTSVQGRPIRLATVGYPAPPPAQPSGSALVVSMQHGHEPATRECALQVIRDLAYTADPDTIAYLTTHPVMVLPAVNPDSHPHTRNNADRIDINRDWLNLLSPENRAVSTLLKDAAPHMVIDMHEVMTPGLDGVGDGYVSGTNQPQAHPAIAALSESLGAACRAELNARGLTGRRYGGGSNPGPLRNHAALRHMLTAIVETDGYNHPPARRVDAAAICVHRALRFHHETPHLGDVLSAAAADKIAEGVSASSPFVLSVPSGVTIQQPAAYLLTDAQHTALAVQRDLLGIETSPTGDSWLVPMGQRAQPLIPYLLDPQSEVAVLHAERARLPGPAREPVDYGPIRIGGGRFRVTGVEVFLEGALRRITP